MLNEVTAVDYRASIINYYDPNSAEIPDDFKLELPDYKRWDFEFKIPITVSARNNTITYPYDIQISDFSYKICNYGHRHCLMGMRTYGYNAAFNIWQGVVVSGSVPVYRITANSFHQRNYCRLNRPALPTAQPSGGAAVITLS